MCRWWPAAARARANTWQRFLLEGHADAVLAASIFHFGELTVTDVKQFLASKGIPVRVG